MAEALLRLQWNSLTSASHSITRLSPSHLRRSKPPITATRTICKAIDVGTTAAAPSPAARVKKNRYEMENLTTWLLKQEQAGYTDTELTIVLSSISLACKQIASLLQRSNIINLTGAQGTINVQGEDQKKLDVISNELFCNCLRSSGRRRMFRWRWKRLTLATMLSFLIPLMAPPISTLV